MFPFDDVIMLFTAHCGSRTCPGEGYLDKNCVCQCPGSPLQVCTGGGGGDEDSGETGGGRFIFPHINGLTQEASNSIFDVFSFLLHIIE